ncbi:anti-sigma factor domain-containing protein [Clostridium kluyveri]|nr:anti-sigma factor domain-containing protein [Clostridium kluyveri]UZQ51252.1 anti-sigma factor domain-containing protein [Clostridium kluyveri]
MMGEKEGIVISINGKYANLLTSCGEFIKVNCNGKKPNIGEIFKGDEVFHNFFYLNGKIIAAAACIMFILFIGGGAKAYYSPVATILVNINPHIELKVNFLNRIISSKALNGDGSKILSQVKINNVNINNGLKIIIDESKKDKFINEDYIKTKTISVNISGKNIDISEFKSNIETSNLNVKIQSNGNIILNKNSNSNSNSSTKITNNDTFNNPSNNVKSLSNENNNKELNSNINKNSSSGKNGSVNGNNSTLDKNNDGGQTNLRQSQYLDGNRIKEEQNYQKRTDKNEDNNHNNNSSKNNLSKQNSNSNGHK